MVANSNKDSNHRKIEEDITTHLRSAFGRSQGYEYVKFLGGANKSGEYTSGQSIDQAKRNLHKFDVVGFIEYQEDFLNQFENRFGVRLKLEQRNRNPASESYRKSIVTEEIEEKMATNIKRDTFRHFVPIAIPQSRVEAGFKPAPTGWRAVPPYVGSHHNGKSLGIIFETASPFETPIKMDTLLKWTNHNLEAKELHPLLTIAIFIVHFLAIHPFQDGNGRLSRILTTLLLSQNGYSYIPYSSLESIVEQNKDNYYLSLRKAQRTLDTDDSGLEIWILFFLNCLKKQKDNLVQKIEREHKMIKFPALSNQILEIIKKHGQATISNIQSITNANRNTIKIRLRELVADKYLIKNGRGKGTWYTIGSRLDVWLNG